MDATSYTNEGELLRFALMLSDNCKQVVRFVPPVPVPEFDYTARVPDGWKIYVSLDDFEDTPITSYGQVRWALEEIQELASNNDQVFRDHQQ